MKHVELIIFDLDGTLVDSKKDIVNAVNFTLKKLGLKEKAPAQISSYIGTGIEDLIRKSLGKGKQALFKKALPVFEDYYRGHFADNTTLYPNVKETLQYYKNKRKVIVTNKKYEFAVSALKTLGIYNYFEDILSGDDSDCLKPSSCPLNKTIGRFNINKDKSIMVGDMDIDVIAGKKAGIITCAVTYGIGRLEDIIRAKPDFIVDDIIKLKNIIR